MKIPSKTSIRVATGNGYISELSNLRWSFGLVALLGLGVSVLIGQVDTKK